jgi:hypothetical protein
MVLVVVTDEGRLPPKTATAASGIARAVFAITCLPLSPNTREADAT